MNSKSYDVNAHNATAMPLCLCKCACALYGKTAGKYYLLENGVFATFCRLCSCSPLFGCCVLILNKCGFCFDFHFQPNFK